MKRIFHFFGNKYVLTFLNVGLACAAVTGNYFIQAFCKPTLWATITLIVCFVPLIFFPLYRDKIKTRMPVLSVLFGIAFCICLYCILFMEEFSLIGILLIPAGGMGLLICVPHWFAIQILLMLSKPVFQGSRKYFFFGIALCVLTSWVFTFQYLRADNYLRRMGANPTDTVEVIYPFMAEKIAGMHFKYHTRICIYDGWRPPLHEPALVIGYNLSGRRDPLGDYLPSRIDLYKRLFPDEPAQVECVCANNPDGRSYLYDPYFE